MGTSEDIVGARFNQPTFEAQDVGLDADNYVLRLGVSFAVSLALLLVLRPPFVLSFTYDVERPWNSQCSVCWTSVLAVSAMASAACVALPMVL